MLVFGRFFVARWNPTFNVRNVLPIGDDWIYGIADVDVVTVAHADGATSKFQLTATWLLHKQTSGEWLIKRQIRRDSWKKLFIH